MPPGTPRAELRLEVRGVSKFFGDHAALKDVRLDIGPGDAVLLYGPNGAGKTTLLRIMASLARPSSGQVLFGGRDVERGGAGAAAKSATGFASHATLLYSELSVRENLRFFGKLFGLADLEARLDGELERFELRGRQHVLARELSRGLQQRVTLARALLHDPVFLLLDEPFTGLDRRSTEKLEMLLKRLPEQGKGVVFSTHNFDQGAALARRLVALEAGRVRYNGPLGQAPLEALGITRGVEAQRA
jgi:heme exporter protein A